MNKKPSEEKVWLKYYKEGAYEKANDIPKNKTVWDVLEEKLFEYYDIPALEYFKREISRADFRDSVYIWARTFRGMGVNENEIVPIYGPFFPDICAMTLALNMIGACPYFLKLAISEEALREETAESKIAIVFDGMWNNVKKVFQDDKFKKVIVASATDSMLHPKKEIVSFMNYINAKKDHSTIPKSKKYIWVDDAKKIANYYTGDVKVPFVSNRSAFITSSSGTTGNLVKGTIATNETAINQLYQAENAEVNFNVGKRCLTNLPPTASTSLNCLFFLPLYKGMTIINEPRLSEQGFYKQMIDYRPEVALTTGSLWEAFFRNVEQDMQKGKKIDLSNAEMYIIGGEGTIPPYYKKWCEIMKKCGAPFPLYSGFGASEAFSVVSVDHKFSFNNRKENKRPVIGIGIPYPGVDVGIFNEDGKEQDYNKRGELWVKSPTIMKGYYKKPELTEKTIGNGWLKTGDICDISEDGFIYLWGRAKDKININDNESLYLFDIANLIRENDNVEDVIVIPMQLQNNKTSLVAHIVFKENVKDINAAIKQIDEELETKLPQDVKIDGYLQHMITLPSSPTTAKKDKNSLAKILNGYTKIINDEVYNLTYENEKNNSTYTLNYKKKN